MTLVTRSSRSWMAPDCTRLGIDVVAAELLEAIAEAAAQALGMVRGLVGTEERPQEVALHR